MSLLSRLFRREKNDRSAPEPSPAQAKPSRTSSTAARSPQAAPRPKPATASRSQPPAPEPAPVVAPSTHEPEVKRLAPAMDEQRARAVLESVLDDLGTAHHRPFSRG